MDDPRIEWIRNSVYQALELTEPEIFDELLNRDDGKAEQVISQFFNVTDDSHMTIVFYKVVEEEDEEIEIEYGSCFNKLISSKESRHSHRTGCTGLDPTSFWDSIMGSAQNCVAKY